MGNRLAEAYVELSLKDAGFLSSLASVQQAFEQKVDAMNSAAQRVKLDLFKAGAERARQEHLEQGLNAEKEAYRKAHVERQRMMEDERRFNQGVASITQSRTAFDPVAMDAEKEAYRKAHAERMRMMEDERRFKQGVAAITQSRTAFDPVAADAKQQADLAAWWSRQNRPNMPSVFGSKQSAEALAAQAKGAGQLHYALLQASFGAQDFAVMYGPMGLGGALRASVNNWAMVAAQLMGPVSGAFAGLAVTLGSVLVSSWDDSKKATDRATDSLRQYGTVMGELKAKISSGMDVLRARNVDSITSGGGAISEIQKSEDTIRLNEAHIERLRESIDAQKNMLNPQRRTERVGRFEDIGRIFEAMTGESYGPVRHAEAIAQDIRNRATGSADKTLKMDAGGGRFEYDPDTRIATFTRGVSKEKREKINAGIEETEKEINTLMRERIQMEERIKSAKERGMHLGRQALDIIKEELGATDELGKKTFQIESHRRKSADSAMEAMNAAGTSNEEYVRVLDKIDDRAKRDKNKAFEEDRDRKDAARNSLTRGLRDDLDRGFAPIGKIFDELEDRKIKINKDMRDELINPNEAQAALKAAEAAVPRQLKELREKTKLPASFSDISGMGNQIQLSMMGGTDQAVKDTARYAKMTVEQLEKLNEKKFEGVLTE